MKRLLLIIWLIYSTLALVKAENYDTLFYEANTAYTNEYYLEAIDNYLKIVDLGYESADLYYNIGNACFKLEDFPTAILYYEKAKKLDQNKEDILFNLSVANTKIV